MLPVRSIAEWLKAFLERRELKRPDGRPLFEYRVTQQEYVFLRAVLRELDPGTSHQCAAFCLYAAEWWRRYGKGLTFDGLLESLNLDVGYTHLYPAIERGLTYWARELRVVRDSTRTSRDFVGSLSREGGLPLQMLLSSQGSVHRFFRRLLQAQRMGVRLDADQAALAAADLPRAWRHPDIYEISARLVRHIWELRGLVGSSSKPVAELDRIRPDWQSRLPILIDDDVAAVLVRGLVEHAQKLAVSGQLGLDVQNRLILRNDRWTFQRLVEPPTQIQEREIWKLLDISQESDGKPRRIQLFVDDGERLRPMAVATQWHADGPFMLTPLVEGTFVTSSTAELLVQAEATAQTYPARRLRGGEPLDSSPWVFIEEDTDDDIHEWRLVAQGSARLRANRALVAFAPGLEISPPSIERCGLLDTPDGPRQLAFVTGPRVSFIDPISGDRFDIETSAPDDEASLYRLDGHTFGEDLRPLVWQGLPSVVAQPAIGVRREVPAHDLEWRPKLGDQPWRSLSSECFGHVELRLRRGGATLFLKSLRIVPATTSYEILPHAHGAILALSGADAVQASLEPVDGLETRPSPGVAEHAWLVTRAEAPPARLTVDLRWTLGRHLRLRLPFPNVGVHFIDRAGRVLPNNATVSLDRLAGCRVEATLPVGDLNPVIEGVLKSRDPVAGSSFSHKLRLVSVRGQTRRFVLDLSRLAEDVRLRLASTTELNASVRLEVRIRGTKARIFVRWFPISMRVDDSRTKVLFLPDKSETFIDEVLARMAVSWLPIEAPDAAPVPLQRTPDGWLVGGIDENPGTKLVVGFDGSHTCARPIIWTAPGELGPPPESLHDVVTFAQAVKLPWKSTRLAGIGKMLDALIEDPGHPEWNQLSPYIASLGQLPSTTYDVLDVLAQRPTLCVHALLSSTPTPGFQTTWSALEDLIFAWRLVPVRDWIRGFRVWWTQLEHGVESLSESVRGTVVAAALTTARNNLAWIEARLFGFTVVRELIEHLLFDATQGQYVNMAAHPSGVGRMRLLETRDEAFMDLYRTHADEHWPRLPAIESLAHRFPDQRPSSMAALETIGHPVREKLLSVTYAPVQAAIASACGISLLPEEVFAIRVLESFDRTWFDICYQTTLTAAVGLLLQHDPERFR